MASVELYGQATTLPALPRPRYDHVSFLHDGALVTCSGLYEGDSPTGSCVTLRPSPEPRAWEAGVVGHLSSSERSGASVVTLAAVGTYVLGGWWDSDGGAGALSSSAASSSELLVPGSNTWTPGPDLPMLLYYGCATPTSRYSFLVTGGAYSPTSAREYSTLQYGPSSLRGWQSANTWPELQQGRMGHACSTIGRKVVIGGGMVYSDGQYSTLSSVEIFDIDTKLVRPGGDLRTARALFHLATVGEGAGQRVLAFGG